MATAQLPLIFFAPVPGTDMFSVGKSLADGSPAAHVNTIDSGRILKSLKATRGFTRLQLALPAFHFNNARAEAAFDGIAHETHLAVHFYGNFSKLAASLFRALDAKGLACYSIWDKNLLSTWPEVEELNIDKGFASRMSRIVKRETLKLCEIEPDPRKRARVLNAFVKSPDFRAEMAKEARLESPDKVRKKKAYSDFVNCYACWKTGHPSALELAAVRKIIPEYALIGITGLRSMIGDSPQFILLKGVSPRRATMLTNVALQHGLHVVVEPP